MAKYLVRKAKGTRKPWGKKNKPGYAIYYKGSRVSPHFANWFQTKAAADRKARGINKDSKGHR